MDNHYRTDSFNILAGHSVGGLFTVHCLLDNPSLFNSYLAISPSLWWNGDEELKKAEEIFNSSNEFRANLFLAYGGLDGASVAPSCINFVKLLKKKAPVNFEWKSICLPNEEHKSTPLKSIYEGLVYSFRNWNPPANSKRNEDKYKY